MLGGRVDDRSGLVSRIDGAAASRKLHFKDPLVDFKMQMIAAIRPCPELWNPKYAVKNAAYMRGRWSQLAKTLEMPDDRVQQEWNSLVKQHSDFLEKKTEMDVRLVRSLIFLRDIRISNINHRPPTATQAAQQINQPGPSTSNASNQPKMEQNRKDCNPQWKIKLIKQVERHDILWKKDLLNVNAVKRENVWNIVSQSTQIPVELCKKEWKLLVNQYKKHLNGLKLMQPELLICMEFMRPHIQTTNSTAMNNENTLNITTNVQEDEDTRDIELENDENIDVDTNSTVYLCSSIIKYMLTTTLPEQSEGLKKKIENTIIQLLMDTKGNLRKQIIRHVRNNPELRPSMRSGVDGWEEVGVPGEICKAVWSYIVEQHREVMMNNNN